MSEKPANVDFGLKSPYNESVYELVGPDTKGVPSLVCKQVIVQNFCPKISVVSTRKSDSVASELGFVNFLEFLRCFEQPLIEQDTGITSQYRSSSKLTVRFVSPISEQLRDQESLLEVRRLSVGGSGLLNSSESISQSFPVTELYNLGALNPFINDHIKDVDSVIISSQNQQETKVARDSIYYKLLTKSISSTTISPFEFFNHPVMQLYVVSGTDSLEDVNETLNGWKKAVYPGWLDVETMLELVLIVVDPEKTLQEGLRLQEELKLQMGTKSVIVPLDQSEDKVEVQKPLFAQLGEELNRTGSIQREIPAQIHETFNEQIIDILYKQLLPYMEKNIRLWTEELVVPRKSFTGRLFNAGKKWGGGNSKKSFFSFGGNGSEKVQDAAPEPSGSSFNKREGYYSASAPEMQIRRLADWSFMIRDYKSSYTTYELLKKDFLTDKAYNYLASLQEFMIVSLLIGASNKVNPLDKSTAATNTNGITGKMISEVINPMVDSSYYSYLSRFNLKTYSIRLVIVIAELFVVLGQSSALHGQSSSSACQLYYDEAIKLFIKLIDSQLLESTSTAVLMERLACIYYTYNKPERRVSAPAKESYYEQENPMKLKIPDLASFGHTRYRKSILWLILAARELDPVSKPTQTKILVESIEQEIEQLQDPEVSRWLHRDDGLLLGLKKSLGIDAQP